MSGECDVCGYHTLECKCKKINTTMIDLINDAMQMILDIGKEKSDFIKHIIEWDNEMKISFKLAYKIIHELGKDSE